MTADDDDDADGTRKGERDAAGRDQSNDGISIERRLLSKVSPSDNFLALVDNYAVAFEPKKTIIEQT